MSQRKTIRRQFQLDLFCQPLTTPDWHQLPEHVQRRARPLLARLLRSHYRARLGVVRAEEVRHE